MIVLFVIGYIGIASEHVLHINKATFALILCGLLWSIYALYGNDANLSADMITALGDTCEIVVFLIGAMTIVELIDRYGGFNIIVHRIRAKHETALPAGRARLVARPQVNIGREIVHQRVSSASLSSRLLP